MDSKGGTYEVCVEFLLGRSATLIKVPHEKDLGIEHFGQPQGSQGAG